jgi:hypothetical protein
MYTHFNAQNICLNNLLVYLLFDLENVRRYPLQHTLIEVISVDIFKVEPITTDYLSKHFVRRSPSVLRTSPSIRILKIKLSILGVLRDRYGGTR